MTYTCTETHNTSEVSSFNSFVSLSSIYSGSATLLVGERMSSNIVTPKCARRTLRVLGRGGGKGCGIVRVSRGFMPTPLRRGRMFNMAFRRNHRRLRVSSTVLSGVIARGGRLARRTGHSVGVSLVVLGCARSGSMYFMGSKRTVNINTKRRSHMRYAELTKRGTSG